MSSFESSVKEEDERLIEHETVSENLETQNPACNQEAQQAQTANVEATEDGDSSGSVSDNRDQGNRAARVQFNKNRKIIIRNVPPVTYEEVKDFLNGYSIDNISISKKSRHAIVTLVDGDKAEEICVNLRDKQLLDTDVTVSVHPNDNLLCVAHLPFNLEDQEFSDIVSEFGGVERCFLLRSDSGKSKGYGFVEWQHNKEKSSQARQMIDNKRIGSCTLHCEFLEPTVLSFEDLHSKCIRVDHLPPKNNYEAELKDLLSRIEAPIFFRLGVRSEGHEFAIVGYADALAAERTQQDVNGFMLNGHRIRVTFCIPGQKPDDIFAMLMANAGNKMTGLLPPPPSLLDVKPNLMNLAVNPPSASGGNRPAGLMNEPDITNPAMQSLLAQSPQVLQTFQMVLAHLQQQNVTRLQSAKPGLLGMAPHMPHNNLLLNPNMQVALLAVILASQIQQAQPSILNNPSLQQMISNSMQQQSNMSRPSLLGNPMIAQANMMLQTSNLLKMLGGPAPNAQNINMSMFANFSQLVNILQGFSGPQLDTGGSAGPQQRPNSVGVSSGVQSSGNAPKGLLGDAPNSQSSGALLGNGPSDKESGPPGLLGDRPGQTNNAGAASSKPAPLLGDRPGAQQSQQSSGSGPAPSLMDIPTAPGPANPLLALFLEQQIRQQMIMQNNEKQDNFSQGNSGSLKRRHISVSNSGNMHAPQSQSYHSSAPGGLLPTPSGAHRPLLPHPPGDAESMRALFSANSSSKPSNGLLPTPDYVGDGIKDETGRVPHLMQSFVSAGMSHPGAVPGANRDDLNSPAKKFIKMDGSRGDKQGTGLLGDMPDAIKERIIGYATGRSSNLDDKDDEENGNKDTNSYDPTTGYWAKQSDYGYGYNMSAEHWQSTYSSTYDSYQGQYSDQQKRNQYSNNQSQSSQQQQQQNWYQQGSEYSQYYQQYYDQSRPSQQQQQQQGGYYSQATYSGQPYSYGTGNQAQSSWSSSQGYQDSSVAAPPPPPPLPPEPSSSKMDPWTVIAPSSGGAGSSSQRAEPPPPGTQPPGFRIPPAVGTPVGGERGDKKPHLLPSPEPSPDGHYVGQHSQGLGGHYADSYVKRGRLDI